MPNNLTTVAQTLLEKIKDTNVAEHKPSDKRTTQLNYELIVEHNRLQINREKLLNELKFYDYALKEYGQQRKRMQNLVEEIDYKLANLKLDNNEKEQNEPKKAKATA